MRTAVMPFLRRQRSRHIASISSTAGLAPMAGSGLYAAAKLLLEGASEVPAQEGAPPGILTPLVTVLSSSTRIGISAWTTKFL